MSPFTQPNDDDLYRAILDVARMCAPVNRSALDNPRVHVTTGDAREVLMTGTVYSAVAGMLQSELTTQSAVRSFFTFHITRLSCS